ncbi:hypothetical protein BH23GEM7_BH23GEM7_30280 [soil metagenome]
MRRYYRTLAALLLVLAVEGCAAAGSAASGSLRATNSHMVHVDNQSMFHVTIYALHGETPVMLGRVDMLRTRSFAVPAGILEGGTVRLMAARPGSRHQLLSEPLWLTSGQQVSWRLMDAPGISSGPGWGMITFTSPTRRPY